MKTKTTVDVLEEDADFGDGGKNRGVPREKVLFWHYLAR